MKDYIESRQIKKERKTNMTEKEQKELLADIAISANMAKTAYQALEDKQGEDIKILDIHEISVLADYFLIAHGNNPNHVKALIDAVEDQLAELGYATDHVEGYHEGTWVLLDFGRIIVHVFHKEARVFYDLERIWADGKQVSIEELPKA